MELRLLRASDAQQLWAFENAHRQYFETWINARPSTFYTPEGFGQTLQAALLEQAADKAFHYLIWEEKKLVGRINLTQVRRAHFQSASLGYRIAPGYSGQGLASDAVAAVMQKAFQEHHLQRLEATARPENPASIRVLLKNGFHQFGHSQSSIELHRQWFDLLYFEAHAQSQPAR
ncbi:MAG: GNAT family N-acetyltransferase [Comamonas sp.]|jgi:ribosomal-protein-alanine N-acetyltransferase|nr:GNAT family N-acetyltransferase [Comamonas sp.]